MNKCKLMYVDKPPKFIHLHCPRCGIDMLVESMTEVLDHLEVHKPNKKKQKGGEI